MNNAPTKDEVLEQVRVNLLRYLERNPAMTVRLVAHAVNYSCDTVWKFANGSVMTVPVAGALVMAFPEIGKDFTCRCCGRLDFDWR